MVVGVTLAPSETETRAMVHDRPRGQQTTCCIVGGGPAGAVLALLLARQGVPVMLLEAHTNFDRDFRGNTLNPSVMEIMDELGLAGCSSCDMPKYRVLPFRPPQALIRSPTSAA